MDQTQIVYAKPPADGALPDPAGTFNVVHTPFDSEATNLEAGEALVENQYLSIDPYDKRYGLKNLHSIVGMDITIQSYRSSSWEHLVAKMREDLEAPLSDARLTFKTHVVEGLENLPAAFHGMFTGQSFGTTVVKV